MRLDDAIEDLAQSASAVGKPPFAWFNPDGDTLEIYLDEGPYLLKRVDDLFTVFVAADDNDEDRVVGVAVKNITRHFGASGLSHVFLHSGRAEVAALLLGANLAREYRMRQTKESLVLDDADALRNLLRRIGHQEVELPPEMLRDLERVAG